jgi:uncharacterized glyoxalase superfamily protein PhnB
MPGDFVPHIACEEVFPLMGVKNIGEAVDYYSNKLGFKVQFTWGDPPGFAGMTLGNVAIQLSSSMPERYAGFAYFVVSDAKELHSFHLANGIDIIEPPAERDYEMYDYRIRDPWGNELGFGHHIYTMGPPIPIQRVDVPVRLEKRLAALLRDLAEHKGMTIDSCLEETLLHTFEPLGEGVASPHTKTTLHYIEQLKKKHGIDYDSHGSYRFKEE